MGKEQTKDLLKFLKPFGDDITELVIGLRDFASDLCPKTIVVLPGSSFNNQLFVINLVSFQAHSFSIPYLNKSLNAIGNKT